jgi:8-amino-7-oxononanoate synthase
MNFPHNLSEKMDRRFEDGTLRNMIDRHELVDFSSNDYLGFSINKSIIQSVAAHSAGLKHANGSTGSRLLTGNFELHEKVEAELAHFFGCEEALLFNSGYDANIGLLSSVPQRGDKIFYDELCHASIRDGIRLSNASSYGFRHNSLDDLEKKFHKTKSDKGEVYLVVEAVYSMDGDQSPLSQLIGFSEKNGLRLIVDEAHSTGVFGKNGKGLVAGLHLHDRVFARIHTFGKAMGCHGAAVCGEKALKNYLINFARSFIYTTAMPLHNVLSIKYALQELRNTKEIDKLWSNITTFKSFVRQYKMDHLFLQSESPIQSCLLPPSEKTRAVSRKLMEHHYDARAILSPTVPKGRERIRFCVHSYNTPQEIREVLFLLSTFV